MLPRKLAGLLLVIAASVVASGTTAVADDEVPAPADSVQDQISTPGNGRSSEDPVVADHRTTTMDAITTENCKTRSWGVWPNTHIDWSVGNRTSAANFRATKVCIRPTSADVTTSFRRGALLGSGSWHNFKLHINVDMRGWRHCTWSNVGSGQLSGTRCYYMSRFGHARHTIWFRYSGDFKSDGKGEISSRTFMVELNL